EAGHVAPASRPARLHRPHWLLHRYVRLGQRPPHLTIATPLPRLRCIPPPQPLALCLQEVLVPGSSAPWPCSLPASRTRRAVPPGSSQTAQPVEAARGGGFTAPPSPSRLLPASLRSPQSHNHRLLVDDGSIGAPNGSQSHHHF